MTKKRIELATGVLDERDDFGQQPGLTIDRRHMLQRAGMALGASGSRELTKEGGS